MRRLVDDADAPEEPLEILEEKIPVLEKSEHAQIHAYARDQPAAARTSLDLRNLSAEPEVHRSGGKKERGERRIPCAIKNITGDDEEVLAQRPGRDAPVERYDDYEKDDESERIKKHGEKPKELICRTRQSIYASHIEGRFFRCCFVTLQDKEALQLAAQRSMIPLTSRLGYGTAWQAILSLRERKPSVAGEGGFVL